MTKEEALNLLTEIDKIRVSAEARPDDYPGDYSLRVAQAIIAKAAGFDSRSSWSGQLDQEAIQAQRDKELDKKLEYQRARNEHMNLYGAAATNEAVFAAIREAQNLEANLRKRHSNGLHWQECEQIIKSHVWRMQAIQTKFS